MTTEDKKTETNPAPSKESIPENRNTPGATDGAATSPASSSTYSRGEGQKPVSQAYRDNWNTIFAKKKKR
jgi:hypothetical protein